MMKQQLKDFITGLGMVALAAAGYVFKDALTKGVTHMCSEPTSYKNAVDAIMDTVMCGSDKEDALRLLEYGKDSDYYSAVIKVMDSVACGSDKVDMIRILNEKVGP